MCDNNNNILILCFTDARTLDLDQDIPVEDGDPGDEATPTTSVHTMSITGVTQTESDDFLSSGQQDDSQVEPPPLDGHVGYHAQLSYQSERSDWSEQGGLQTEQFDTLASRVRSDVGTTSDARLATLTRNKWTSTPELRQEFHHTLNGCQEDVASLYGNLLHSTEVQEYENELLEPRRRRQQEHYFPMQQSSLVRRRTGLNKYLTLPPRGDQYEPMDGQEPHAEQDAKRMVPDAPICSTSRSVIVVSGGEGHINWSQKNAGDNRYEDICLLLWQCQT